MYGILLGTRDRQVRGVTGQLDQDRFGFAALIKHFGDEGEISDKLERQEHLMLLETAAEKRTAKESKQSEPALFESPPRMVSP